MQETKFEEMSEDVQERIGFDWVTARIGVDWVTVFSSATAAFFFGLGAEAHAYSQNGSTIRIPSEQPDNAEDDGKCNLLMVALACRHIVKLHEVEEKELVKIVETAFKFDYRKPVVDQSIIRE